MKQVRNCLMSALFRIILNHWSILTRTSRFVKPFVNELEPNLIIIKGDSHHVCKDFLFVFDENNDFF
jgi:hypothetical protein